jgi:probable phosphoglycerate mutase
MNQALPEVYLVRHADTAWTLTGQHTGRTDLPLTEQGEGQARALGPTLTALRIDRILSSPLQRARRAAEMAVPHARVEADDDLKNWDYGAYASLSVLGYDHDLTGPVIHAWNASAADCVRETT